MQQILFVATFLGRIRSKITLDVVIPLNLEAFCGLLIGDEDNMIFCFLTYGARAW